MEGNPPSEIDTLALRIERLIAKNEEILGEYEDNYTPYSESTNGSAPGMGNLDAEELFS